MIADRLEMRMEAGGQPAPRLIVRPYTTNGTPSPALVYVLHHTMTEGHLHHKRVLAVYHRSR